MFGFKKLDRDVLGAIRNLLETQATKIIKLEAEVEAINGKLRKKIYRDEVEESEGDNKPDEHGNSSKAGRVEDGFDELRRLNKVYKD